MPNVFKDVTSVPIRSICPGYSMNSLSCRGRDEEGILEDLLGSHPISGRQGPDEPVHLSPHREFVVVVQLCSPQTSLHN